jgi:polygalacturonase
MLGGAPVRALESLQAPAGWAQVDDILRRIVPPVFPDRAFAITAHGARPGGADATAAIRDAIRACAAAGGGRVVVPAGEFQTGAIRLESGVNLHLEAGAALKFSRDPRAYLPAVFTRFEGVELMNYSPFIYAFEARDIAITGAGTLDGQADDESWWRWARGGRGGGPSQVADRQRLFQMGADGVPVRDRVFGDGHYIRPNFIQPYRCQNVLIEGVRVERSPMWEVHPVLCTNVTVRGLTIVTHGPNNDGCNPESCRDVLIERCTFDTGDDCIAIKSGRNNDGRRVNVPVENVIIRDCVMKDGHGGVTVGSEISGGARHIFAERCQMDSPQLDRALRFKTNSVRGGIIEHVYMRDVTVGQVAESVVHADFFYEEGDAGAFPPVLRDVEVRNVTSQKSRYAFLLRGYAHAPIADVRVIDCTFNGVAEPDVLEGVRGLVLTNVRINGAARNERIDR